MDPIIRFFAREHLFGNLLTVIIIVFGIYALNSMRRDIWPNVDFNVTVVSTTLPGASPEQVEKLVINPIEEAIREVEGLDKVFSTATESVGVTVLQLDPDSRDPDKTNQDIQQAVDRVEDLPETADEPLVKVIETDRLPVIEVTVAGEKNTDEMLIRNTAKDVADEVSRLPLVASVTKQGFRKREFVVVADPEKMARRKTSLSSMISTIQGRNISLPGGDAISDNGSERLIRTEAEFQTPKDIEKAVLLANESGFGTRIGDIAQTYEQLAKPERLYKANGKPSVNMIVAKKSNADTFALIGSIKELIEKLDTKVPKGITLGFSNDLSTYLSKRLNALSSNLLIGLFLVLLVLTLFLPWQVALVVAVGIPVALFATLLAAYLLGFSLNLISLIGLIIVLGMLVDDAIVVSENVWRHYEESFDIYTSTIKGTSEVFAPVLASILTTVSAFGPMLFMTGIFGAFVFEIPLMVILALGFSMFEAFIIMPSHFTSWVKTTETSKQKVKSYKDNHWFNGITEKYINYVQFSLRHRYGFLLLAVVLLAATGISLGAMGRFILFPKEGTELFFIQVETPMGTTLRKTMELIEPIEHIVSQLPDTELKDYVSSAGIIQQDQTDPQSRRGSQYAQIRVALTPQNRRDRIASEIIDKLRQDIGLPAGIEKVSFEEARQGPPQGRPISLNILGQDFATLQKIGDEIMTELKNTEGVEDLRSSFLPGKEEYQVVPDDKKTAVAGLTALQISQSVRAAFEGIVASSVRELDEEVDIRVRLEEKRGGILDQLRQLKVGNRLGNLIPLNEVADFKEATSRSAITHLEYRRLHNISAEVDLDKNTPSAVIKQIEPKIEELVKKYPGYNVKYGGENEDTEDSFAALGRAFLFAAFIIFALLIVTFKNLLQPLLVLTSIPLGFMGVALAMFVHNRPFSFMAMLGVIALAGVIVNNSIVFTDFVNSERKRGKDEDDSILDAARTRLRPIVLTTLTTVCGLLPTAYGETLYKTFGIGGGDPFIVPIALSLGWGMAFGSLLTAIFFPSFVRIVDDIQNLFRRLFASETRS